MSGEPSPNDSEDKFEFSSDEDFRRPRRAAANRSAFVESGTDDEDDAPGLKRKAPKKPKKPVAKKPRRDSDSSESDTEETMKEMQNLTEKERELQIFRHIEQQEMIKTRKEIQQRLLGDNEEEEPKKKKDEKAKSDKESGEESSSEDEAPEPAAPAPTRKAVVKSDTEEESAASDLDTEFHAPSDIAKKMEKKHAIAELVKSRKEKRHNEEKRKEVLDVSKVFGDDEKSSDDSDESSSSDSSDSESDGDSDNDRRRSRTPETRGEPIDNVEYINRIRLSRFKLSKLCHAPFFEKTVLGCFVRIGVGQANGVPVYRAAQVIGVLESQKTYDVENTRTNKALRLKHGPDERVYRLEFISNSVITEKEYLKWRQSMLQEKLPLPTTDYIDKKYNDINKALTYEYTDADVTKMVEQRQKFMRSSGNSAVRKAELMKEKADAEQAGDVETALKLQMEIDSLDEEIKRKERQRCHDSIAITFINQRNRDMMQKAAQTSKTDDADLADDPFTRKSRYMTFVSEKKKQETAAQEKPLKSAMKSNGMNHSVSAPQLTEKLLAAPVPAASQSKPVAPVAASSSKPVGDGKISFAEYRRRKAEAAAMGGAN